MLSPNTVIKVGEFEYAGYTNLEAGVPAGTGQRSLHETYMDRMSNHPLDIAKRDKTLEQTCSMLNSQQLNRAVTVIPVDDKNMGYERGGGVRQYILKRKKEFDVVAKVLPG